MVKADKTFLGEPWGYLKVMQISVIRTLSLDSRLSLRAGKPFRKVGFTVSSQQLKMQSSVKSCV